MEKLKVRQIQNKFCWRVLGQITSISLNHFTCQREMIKLVPCGIEGDIRKGICKVSRTQQDVIIALFIVTIVTIITIIFYLKEHYLKASPITSNYLYVMELPWQDRLFYRKISSPHRAWCREKQDLNQAPHPYTHTFACMNHKERQLLSKIWVFLIWPGF